MLRRGLAFGALMLVSILVLVRCGSDSATTSYVYSSTSQRGDFAEWTVSGSTLTVVWQATDSSGNITKTFNVTATCGAADATYGYKSCTVSSASCTNGTQTCGASDTPSGTFRVFEIPGLALMVHTGDTGSSRQLHIGMLKDTSCGSAAGDYTFMHIGVSQTDLFGLYRADATFNSVTHADFKMSSAGSTTTPSIAYSTGSGTGNGVETLTGSDCVSGVRTRVVGGNTIRSMVTPAGLYILDLPAGSGGLVAFKTSLAAGISDLASKNFGGVSFPDNSTPDLIAATTGAVSGTSVSITSLSFLSGGSAGSGMAFKPATDTSSSASSPSYPNFTSSVAAYTSNNSLASTYATPSAIPGLFKIDGNFGSDTGRVVMVAMKYNSKVIGFGSVYNWRSTSGGRLENTGAFILFEK